MAENIIGKFVIELDENDRKLLERFVDAVELLLPANTSASTVKIDKNSLMKILNRYDNRP